jgi:hypothetical protein
MYPQILTERYNYSKETHIPTVILCFKAEENFSVKEISIPLLQHFVFF